MKEFDKQMEMVLYHSDEGDISVDAYIKDESLWITQKSMSDLFGIDKSGISRHLKKIFETGELDEKVVVAKFATTSRHGALPGKTQSGEEGKLRQVKHCKEQFHNCFPILLYR